MCVSLSLTSSLSSGEMGGKAQLELCLLLLAVCVSGSLAAKPLGGKFTGEKAIVQTLFVEKDAKSDEVCVCVCERERED